MKLIWDVDDSTVVQLTLAPFGVHDLTTNGAVVANDLALRSKSEAQFELSGGRSAKIIVKPLFGTTPLVELRVDGILMVPTGKKPVTCGNCGVTMKPNDRFCPKCGQEMPPAENYAHQKRLTEAAQTIWVLAALFAIFGVVEFFLTRSQAAKVLDRLSGLNPTDRLIPINGVVYTAAALRERLLWEPWNVLLVNAILALSMAVLAFWGRRAPLAAILIAAAIYAVVNVASAIIDPASIAQGIYIKVIVVLFLFRGIHAALALRNADAR
ncbi:MAG: zinc ribbon domain-containing protein [Rhizomicrobium sp.]|jgi:hypothetical protein